VLASGSTLQVPTSLRPRVESVCARLADRPDRFRAPTRRSRPADEAIADGVAQARDGRIDLEPLLTGLAPKSYRVRFQPISAPNAAPAQPFDVLIDGNATTWTGFWPGVPGQFRASLYPLPSGPRIGDEVWVIVAEGRFAETTAAFKAIAAMVDGWGAAVAPEDAKLFLHAAVEDLVEKGLSN
jgi:hypothetical protein